MSFKEIKPTEDLVKKEHEILSFWKENKIFDKLVEKNKGKEKWSFLDGPITANNPMGVHHAWGRTYKDLFQRFKAMQGFEERFQNGFDCQGLWVEVEVEKELGFKTKKDIEKYGIEKFVEKCKERVLKYSKIQIDQSIRLGQWMDWDNSYFTMSDENNYAIWHFLKKCFDKGYLYKGRDSVPWCPRCGTAISQHEILTEEYKELTHDSIYLEYPILERKDEYLIVWTTTPWTLPGNVAIAADSKKEYVQAEGEVAGNKYYLSKTAAEKLNLKIIKTIKGTELIGLKYQSPFDGLPEIKKAMGDHKHQVVATDTMILPISDEEGTSLIHIAPGAGSEDYQLSKKLNLPVIELIDGQANYLNGLGEFSNHNAKVNPGIIIDYLQSKENGKYFFSTEKYTHRYPTCWRCKTELVWRVVDEWYIKMDELRQEMIKVTKKIKWLPSFGLDRELDWLNNMQDWMISKKRYWGLALPIYECKKCGQFEVIGSKTELKEKAVEGWEKFDGKSPHRPWVDEVKIKCSKCGETVSRISDVGNPWLDAGIVPFSTLKYFEDKSYWQEWFPAKFICESFPGQFKNWFYSLIAMSAVLENTNSFETVLGYALVRDERGEEMHKSKGNAIWFNEAAEKMGVDVMRWMFVSADPYENLSFGYKPAEEIKRRFVLIFKNVYSFFATYANIDNWQPDKIELNHILDFWITSKLNQLITEVTENLDKYRPQQAASKIEDFVVNDLSTWYLRRSRKRRDKEFYSTIYQVLISLVKLMAPFTPFLADDLFQNLKRDIDPESVHLCDWPKAGETNQKLINEMKKIRSLVEIAHAQRAAEKIKTRQPLASATINIDIENDLQEILKEEINVKEIIVNKKINEEILLDTKLTPVLEEEGLIRDIVRSVQDLRKKANLSPADEVNLYYQGEENLIKKYQSEIEKNTNTKFLNQNIQTDFCSEQNTKTGKIWLGLLGKNEN